MAADDVEGHQRGLLLAWGGGSQEYEDKRGRSRQQLASHNLCPAPAQPRLHHHINTELLLMLHLYVLP